MFSLNELRIGNILILGFRHTGKSTLVKEILKSKGLKNGLIINPRGNNYEEFDNVVEYYNGEEVNDFLVLDDCHNPLEILEKTKPKFFILVEMSKSFLPREFESNINTVFIFRDGFYKNRNKIYNQYLLNPQVMSMETFYAFMNTLEDTGDCLVLLYKWKLLFYHNKI